MFRVVKLQAGTTLLASVVAGLLAGPAAAVSALLGGLACTVPNALFALHLTVQQRLPSPGGQEDPKAATRAALGLLAGEFLKVFLTIALMAIAGQAYGAMVWPAMILTIIAVLAVMPAAVAWRGNGSRH